MAKKKGRMTVRDYRALARFRQALRQFLSFSEAAAAEAGLTPTQHQALLAVKGMPRSDTVSVGDLADWLGVRHHSCVGLVDRLEILGLVTKHPDRADRRRVTLTLTRQAERKLAALSAAHRDELRRRAGALKVLLSAMG